MRIWILSNVAFYMANNLHALFGYRFRMMITRTGKSLRIYFMDVNDGIPNEVISIRAEKGNDGIRLWLNQKYFNFFELSPNKQLEFVRFLISDFCDSYSIDTTSKSINLRVAQNSQFDYENMHFTYKELSNIKDVETDYPLLHWIHSEFEFNIAMETEKYATDVKCHGFSIFSYELLNGTPHLALNIQKCGNNYSVTTKSALDWSGFQPEFTINYLSKFINSSYSLRQTGKEDKNIEIVFSCSPNDNIIRIERFLNNGLSREELKEMIPHIHSHLGLTSPLDMDFYEKSKDVNLMTFC
ncbi:MAG: hypothetical protein IKY64_06430 [Bacteroidaceae bacterium]|nr:hypothetical protein [Bacteroidaceae bacterium]